MPLTLEDSDDRGVVQTRAELVRESARVIISYVLNVPYNVTSIVQAGCTDDIVALDGTSIAYMAVLALLSCLAVITSVKSWKAGMLWFLKRGCECADPQPPRGQNWTAIDPQLPEAPSCLLYTSPSPRDRTRSRMPSSA